MDNYKQHKKKSKDMRVLNESVTLDFKFQIKEFLPLFRKRIIKFDQVWRQCTKSEISYNQIKFLLKGLSEISWTCLQEKKVRLSIYNWNKTHGQL